MAILHKKTWVTTLLATRLNNKFRFLRSAKNEQNGRSKAEGVFISTLYSHIIGT